MREIDNLRAHLTMVARELDQATHGSGAAERFASELGWSINTLYRKLQSEIGYASGRKTRADKGSTGVPASSLDFIAAAQKVSRRKNGKLVLQTPMATALAMNHGVPVGVCASHVQRLLVARGLDARTQARDTPPQMLRSLHPNHVHEFDWSVCLMYYAPDGAQHIIHENVAYKNKPEQFLKAARDKNLMLRGVLVDHATGVPVLHYVAAKGETKEGFFEALMNAWQKREGRVFHGVPKILYVDKGLDKAYAIKNLCAALEVELISHEAGNARATGAVERMQDVVERTFESLLRFQPAHSVEELNERAFAWSNAYAAGLLQNYDSRVRREGLTALRLDLWLKHIRPEHIRLCPPTEECAIYMRGASAERQISHGLTIRYRHPKAPCSRTYEVKNIRELRAGMKVIVRPLVYSDEGVVVEFEHYDGTRPSYTLSPVRDYDVFGRRLDTPVIGESFASLPRHQDEADGLRLDEIAYGVDADGVIRDREAIEKAKDNNKANPFANWCEGQGLKPFDVLKGIQLPTYLPKKGTPIVPKITPLKPLQSIAQEKDGGALCVPSPAQFSEAETRLNHIEMAKRLRAALGDAWTGRYAEMVALYPDCVTYEEMPAVIDRFKRLTGLTPGLRAVK